MARRVLLLLALVALAAAAPVVGVRSSSASLTRLQEDHCGGVWRWDVKTLSDARADQVKLMPQSATVRGLNELRRPRRKLQTDTPRYKRVESKSYRVTAELVKAKRSEDRDIHLVIRDRKTDATLIVEFPDVRCRGATGSTAKPQMKSAREAFAQACGGEPSTKFVALSGEATIEGVGFWDKDHGQAGNAENFVELHPAIRFESADCQRV